MSFGVLLLSSIVKICIEVEHTNVKVLRLFHVAVDIFGNIHNFSRIKQEVSPVNGGLPLYYMVKWFGSRNAGGKFRFNELLLTDLKTEGT